MRIDYDTLADSYDRHRRGGGPYLDRLLALIRESRAQRILELGAGTGNCSAAVLHACHCERFIGLEPSSGMLRKAVAKKLPAHWVRGDALHVPLRSNSMHFIFSVYMLHHITHLDQLLAECARVLAGGCLAFVTATHGFIRRHPMNAYFPSFARIDTARFQDLPEVSAAFAKAGFSEVNREVCVAQPIPIDSAYVERVAGKFVSTYALLPEKEFRDGLARLRADVAKHGKLPNPIALESAIIWGQR